jgi:phosphoserine phosphatase
VEDLVGLGLTRDDMMDTLVDTVFPGDEASVNLDTKTKGAVTREWKKREGDRIVRSSGVTDSTEDVYDSEEEDMD